jgi:hypothetical protein
MSTETLEIIGYGGHFYFSLIKGTLSHIKKEMSTKRAYKEVIGVIKA